jgi:hypothetical protein
MNIYCFGGEKSVVGHARSSRLVVEKKTKPQTLGRDGVTKQGVILDFCSVLHLF